MTLRRWLLIGVAMVIFLVPISNARAEVVPSAQDIFVMPGGRASLDIPLENTASFGKTFSVSLLGASLPSGEDSQPVLTALPPALAAWISLASDSLTLVPGGRDVVTLTVQPSASVTPGIYGVAVVATEKTDGSIALNHGSAALVFITVGRLSPLGSCTQWSRNTDGTFSVTLVNSGGGILYQGGAVELRGPFGISFASTPLNPNEHRVLPGQTRAWTTDSIAVPWWSFGGRSFVLSDDRLSATCTPIDAGFGWVPILPLGIVSLGAVAVVLRRRR
jgi:hypothetical protein